MLSPDQYFERNSIIRRDLLKDMLFRIIEIYALSNIIMDMLRMTEALAAGRIASMSIPPSLDFPHSATYMYTTPKGGS